MRSLLKGCLLSVTWIGALLGVLEVESMAVRLLILLAVAPISLVVCNAGNTIGSESGRHQTA